MQPTKPLLQQVPLLAQTGLQQGLQQTQQVHSNRCCECEGCCKRDQVPVKLPLQAYHATTTPLASSRTAVCLRQAARSARPTSAGPFDGAARLARDKPRD